VLESVRAIRIVDTPQHPRPAATQSFAMNSRGATDLPPDARISCRRKVDLEVHPRAPASIIAVSKTRKHSASPQSGLRTAKIGCEPHMCRTLPRRTRLVPRALNARLIRYQIRAESTRIETLGPDRVASLICRRQATASRSRNRFQSCLTPSHRMICQ